jgi:hypothetical protein
LLPHIRWIGRHLPIMDALTGTERAATLWNFLAALAALHPPVGTSWQRLGISDPTGLWIDSFFCQARYLN